jgi:hypothetical protein
MLFNDLFSTVDVTFIKTLISNNVCLVVYSILNYTFGSLGCIASNEANGELEKAWKKAVVA